MSTVPPNMQNYDQYYRDFQWEVPLRFNFGRDVVDRWARDRSRLALLWEDASGRQLRFTFGDISDLSARLGNALRALGVQPADRVLVHLPRIPEWFIATIACLKVGAVAIPTAEMMQAKDLQFRATHAGAVALFTTPVGAEHFDTVAAACPVQHRIVVGDPVTGTAPRRDGWMLYTDLIAAGARTLQVADSAAETPAMMYYTSGTTGQPKGVLHAERALFAWREQAYCWLDNKPDDLHWCTADTGWSKFGTSMVFGPWSWGTPLLMYHGPFDPEQRFHFLAKHRVTTFCAAPTELRLMVQHNLSRWDLGALRHCVSAGEPLNPEVITRWHEGTGLHIYDGYGQTEALMACHNYRCLPIRPGSMGKPLPGYVLAVVDAEGMPLPAEREGDLAIHLPNPCLMLGHWANPNGLNNACRGEWYITGDRAWMDEDGYYWFVSRADDVILSAGYRIGPFEVENALSSHPAVVESAAVGSPDLIRGEIVKAFVVLRAGYVPSPALVAELQAHAKRVTAPYKYPREIEFVAALPKTITGKIRRAELKRQEIQRKGQFMGVAAPVREG
jgi:acetyl-CoA synthetase